MNISKNARVWIYQSNRCFTINEETQIQQMLDTFTAQWQAHGHQLAAIGEIKHHLFIILSIDEQHAGATGCSIDKSVAMMKDIEQQFGVNLFDRFQIAYRVNAEVKSASRSQFIQLLNEGIVAEDVTVFNNLITTRDELETDWEVVFNKSWHAQVFQ